MGVVEDIQKFFSELCTPAFIYFVIAAIHLVGHGILIASPDQTLVGVLSIAALTWLMATLCKRGFATLSWAILIAAVLLPYIWFFGAVVLGALYLI